MSEETQKACNLQRTYAKDISFEAPGAPDAFLEPSGPKLHVTLNNSHRRLGEGDEYEVTVTTTVTATFEDNTAYTAYIAEATQAAIFTVQGFEGEELDHILGAYCPNLIFPFLRETISNLIMRGTFPQFLMKPINFDALYHDARKQREQQESSGAGSTDQTH